ncbi:Cytochrome c oxidase subunit 3 [Linum grandiflorum]
MKERNSGLRNKSSKAKRIGLFQRITAALLLPLIIIYKKLSSTFLPNLFLFWHINEGIKEIMADYVHQEMTRNLILVYLRLFFLIVIKDVFLFVWWRDVLRESTLEGHHTKIVQLGPRYGFILFIVSEVMFFFTVF